MKYPSKHMLLVELVATLDSLIAYSNSYHIRQQATIRRDELMKIDEVRMFDWELDSLKSKTAHDFIKKYIK